MKTLVKQILGRWGFELCRITPGRDPFLAQQQLLRDVARPVIFDVGAHIGQTVRLYKERFPDSSIFAFEPFAESFAQLRHTCERLPNVECVNCALGRETTRRTFHVNRYSATNSLLNTDPAATTMWGGLQETVAEASVAVDTIDHFLRTRPDIPGIDILKLDVQGAEYEVLLGAAETLKRKAVTVIYTEIIIAPTYVGQPGIATVVGALEQYGYRLFNLYELSQTLDGRLKQLDAIFVAK